jgi:DNA-binding XRE family transcriptional regulator
VSALDALLRELGVDLSDESVQLAVANYRNERTYLWQLTRRRRLSEQTIASRMGVSEQAVRELEDWDSDPTLQRIRRYAHAIGATTIHTVTDAEFTEPTC